MNNRIKTAIELMREASSILNEAENRSIAYDNIDRFLRNNLSDEDYAEYSLALETLFAAPQAQDFDAWMQNPYTRVLQKSIKEDYVPKSAQAQQEVGKDAERYRWLRSPERGMSNLATVISDDFQPPYFELKCGEELDAAIDAITHPKP